MTREDRIRGGLWGLLVGDALGVPYEFKRPEQLPPFDRIEMRPPPEFRRSHARVRPGTWSDDGAQTLALLDSLLTCGALDLDDFAGRLVRWFYGGHYAVGRDVFDVGNQTAHALRRIQEGVSPRAAASTHERANGNGALMRALPLALWHRGSDADRNTSAPSSSAETALATSSTAFALRGPWSRRRAATKRR